MCLDCVCQCYNKDFQLNLIKPTVYRKTNFSSQFLFAGNVDINMRLVTFVIQQREERNDITLYFSLRYKMLVGPRDERADRNAGPTQKSRGFGH